jgi:hypothetical protein
MLNRRAAGDLIVEGTRHLGKKNRVRINKILGDETLSNLPLQGDQALTCGDGEQEEVLRDEERRDGMIPGCRGAVQGEV